ncbi:unnamed protein product [Ranitomeya imitator]|uniref:C2H2-type domain-containing protein n=1 Tax=Ranitomeya imitator TaxID=111125 RepID=A0ABN9MBW2_9NEOB|nr:unnamed protein product [Ranitomeya imitator]
MRSCRHSGTLDDERKFQTICYDVRFSAGSLIAVACRTQRDRPGSSPAAILDSGLQGGDARYLVSTSPCTEGLREARREPPPCAMLPYAPGTLRSWLFSVPRVNVRGAVTAPCIAISRDDDVAVSRDRYVIISRDRNALLRSERVRSIGKRFAWIRGPTEGHRLGSGCVEKLHPLPTLCTIFTTCVGMSGRRIATAPYRPPTALLLPAGRWRQMAGALRMRPPFSFAGGQEEQQEDPGTQAHEASHHHHHHHHHQQQVAQNSLLPLLGAPVEPPDQKPMLPIPITQKPQPSSEPIKDTVVIKKEKPKTSFICTYCSKAFRDSYHLRRHESCHTGIKLVSRPKKTQTTPVVPLISTIAGDHSRTSLVSTIAGILSTVTTSSSTTIPSASTSLPTMPVTQPVKKPSKPVKKNHACEMCGKAFRDVYHLNRHKLSHSDEKPFECPVCNQRFKRKDRMTYHVRSHEGGITKPYTCSVCGKGFSRYVHTCS